MSSSEIIRNRIKDLADNYYKGGVGALYTSPMSIIVYGLIYGLINPSIESWGFVAGYIFNEFMGIFFGIIGEMNGGFKLEEDGGNDDMGDDGDDGDDMDMSGGGESFDKLEMFKGRVPSYYGLNFGYITGFFLYKYMDSKNYKSSLSLMFLTATIAIAISIFSNKSKISMMVGYLIGLLIGYLIGNLTFRHKKETENEQDDAQVRKACSSDGNEDYVCQSFRDGLLIHETQ